MQRLLPIMGFENELIERDIGGDARQGPVDRHEQRPFGEAILSAFHAPKEMNIDIQKVPEDETEGGQIKNGQWIEQVIGVDNRRVEEDIDNQQHPHQGIHEEDGRFAANGHLQ